MFGTVLMLVIVLSAVGASHTTAVAVGTDPGAGADDGWLAVHTDYEVTCGVRANHSGWCWGRNDAGAVGDGSLTNRTTPSRLIGAWASVSPGLATCGIRTNGIGFCWGDNRSGEVGNGTTEDQPTPVRLGSQDWASITSRYDVTCGVTTDHRGFCWGDNSQGQLGDGTRTDRPRPQQVPGQWSTISPSGGVTCGVQVDQTGWCWGSDYAGEVGGGMVAPEGVTTPTRLAGFWNTVTVARGTATVCGVRRDHSGWCWGNDNFGQVGDGPGADEGGPYRASPRRVPGSWATIRSDGLTTCGVQPDDTGWCWGENYDGEVGRSDASSYDEPAQVSGQWSSITTDDFVTCGRQVDGSSWCWGQGAHGVLGIGHVGDQFSPAPLGLTVLDIAPSYQNTACALAPEGKAYCWGYNRFGTVGNGTTHDRGRPYLVHAGS